MLNTQVMIVEDEGLVAKSIEKELLRLGYEVPAVAMSGEEALEQLGHISPDLALMDIRLSGKLSGLETAEKIWKTHKIPVVYLTAFADDEILREAQKTSCFGYLIKPFQERQLHATIKIALQKAQRETDLTSFFADEQEISNLLHHTSVQLKESNDALLSNNKRMESFIKMISQDLQTPLASIYGLAEFLLKKPDDPEREIVLDRIASVSLTGFRLVQDLLELMSLQSGESSLTLEVCDVYFLFHETIECFKDLAQQRGILLCCHLEDSYEVTVDIKRLGQVLDHLIDNALKFTRPGGLVSLNAVPEKKGLRIEVSDTGQGISAEEISKLFNPFQRMSVFNQEKSNEFGWGLFLSQELIKAHGSKIEVSSRIEEGSCFSFLLNW
ncbi:ATP-binding protein [Deltaproteobacteria bacterium TL4]